jgi:hypothetical protein
MQYGYLEERTHGAQRKAVACRPSAAVSFGSYAQSIFRRLLVHDQLPDTDIGKAIDELLGTLALEDPAFMFGSTEEFVQFAERESYAGKWRKIRQDAYQEIRAEIKRRNIENPYHTNTPQKPEAWDDIPVPDKAYKNKPWQFDMLYRDMHFLAVKIKELALEHEAKFPGDADLFRMKVNGLLAADKIVFALDAGENRGSFLEESANIIESKLSLDGLHLAEVFLGRSLESLRKLGMVQHSETSDRPGALLEFGENVREALQKRITALERRLMLFMRIEKDHY